MINYIFYLPQINAIKERVKNLAILEREIAKYIEEGKDDYKQVIFFPFLFL